MKIPSVLFNQPRTVSKDEAWVIFRAGFMASSSMWNGTEYDFEMGYDEHSDKPHQFLYNQFEEWLNSGE